MRIKSLIWLDEIVNKLKQKHNVSQNEVRQIIATSKHFRFIEKGHRRGENVYAALGQTDGGRHLIVFFVHKQTEEALIISARDMTSAERRLHEKR